MLKKLKRNKVFVLLLSGILVAAFLLRFVELSSYPVGFQIDEAVLGYNGFSFLKTGMDESGARFPLYLDTFGDQNPIGYHVLTIVPIAVFGLSEFSTRLPAAAFGVLGVLAVYYLSFVLFKNKWVSSVAALFFALSPWSINLSRGSSEAHTALFFVTLGFGLVFSTIKSRKPALLLAAFVAFAFSFLIYPAPRVFVPLMGGAVFLYFIKDFVKHKKYALCYIACFTAVVVMVGLLIFAAPGGTNRFQQTSVFSFPEVKLVMEEQIREDGSMDVGPLEARFFHNKPLNFSIAFFENYLTYFSGEYLFMRGGLPMLAHVPNMGLFYVASLPFLLYGIYKIIVKKDKFAGLIIVWLLLSPIVAAMTVDDAPNVRRAVLMIPALEILAAFGLVSFVANQKKMKRKLWLGVIILAFAYCFVYFLHQFFIHGAVHRTWYRNNGFKEMMSVVGENYKEYDKIVLTKTNGGYPLVLFFSQYDPKTYQSEGSPKDRDYKGFGKYVFTPNECPSVNAGVDIPEGTKAIFVDRGTCPEPPKETKFENIYREDGSLGFRVIFR